MNQKILVRKLSFLLQLLAVELSADSMPFLKKYLQIASQESDIDKLITKVREGGAEVLYSL